MNKLKIAKDLEIKNAEFLVLGIASDLCSGYRGGAFEGPEAIRQASKWSSTTRTECGVELSNINLTDLGDIKGKTKDNVIEKMENKIKNLENFQGKFIFLGGDHYWTFEIVRLLSELKKIKKLGLIYFDAHPDILDERFGEKKSHACTVKRILELGNVQKEDIILVGIRAAETPEIEFIKNEKIKFFGVDNLTGLEEEISNLFKRVDKIYISMDLDVIDSAFACGVENPEAGGFTSRQFLNLKSKVFELCKNKIVGFDIMELTKKYDLTNVTALLAVKILYETLGELHKL